VDRVVLIVVVVYSTNNTIYILIRGFIYTLLLKYKSKTKVEVRGKN
jgi:hypothetical protein